VCADGACLPPAFSVEELDMLIARLEGGD